VDIVAQREPRQQCEAQRSLEANWANGYANPTSAVEIQRPGFGLPGFRHCRIAPRAGDQV